VWKSIIKRFSNSDFSRSNGLCDGLQNVAQMIISVENPYYKRQRLGGIGNYSGSCIRSGYLVLHVIQGVPEFSCKRVRGTRAKIIQRSIHALCLSLSKRKSWLSQRTDCIYGQVNLVLTALVPPWLWLRRKRLVVFSSFFEQAKRGRLVAIMKCAPFIYFIHTSPRATHRAGAVCHNICSFLHATFHRTSLPQRPCTMIF
jgi:hypothetical protein